MLYALGSVYGMYNVSGISLRVEIMFIPKLTIAVALMCFQIQNRCDSCICFTDL